MSILPPHKTLRRVALLHPFELPVAVSLVIVAIIFLLFPDMLDHAAVSFEPRGTLHHVWHGALGLGAALTLLGLFVIGDRGLDIEMVGVMLLLLTLSTNFIAQIANSWGHFSDANGLSLATRLALLVALTTRAWIIASRPKVIMTAARDA